MQPIAIKLKTMPNGKQSVMNPFVDTFRRIFGAKNFPETQAGRIIRACFDTADDKKFEKICMKYWQVHKCHIDYAVIVLELMLYEFPSQFQPFGEILDLKRWGYSDDHRFWYELTLMGKKEPQNRYVAGIRALKEREINSRRIKREMPFLRFCNKPSKEQKVYWIALTDKPPNPEFAKIVCDKFNFSFLKSYQIFKATNPKAKVKALSVYLFETKIQKEGVKGICTIRVD